MAPLPRGWMAPAQRPGLRALGATLLRTLLPGCCALCGGPGEAALCPACRRQCFGAEPPRCVQCANPLPLLQYEQNSHDDDVVPAGRCGRCLADAPAFDATLVAAEYALPVDQLVLQLKFGARLQLAGLFAGLLRDAVLRRPDFILPQLLCPVPLGPKRLAGRGFNQALEIARPLARALGTPLHARLAARVRDTQAQTRTDPAERRRNMRLAFVVPAPARELVRGRHVGIVDDVMSSGQTLGELAAAFKRAGAVRVSNLVFARTPPRY